MATKWEPDSCDRVRDPGAWLAEHAGAVIQVARRVARHRGLQPEASDALESRVLARLAQDDYQVLRRCGGGADIETYVAVVATRLLLDQPAASTDARP